MTKAKQPIQPTSTRRRISAKEWHRNRALYAHWEEVGTEPDITGEKVGLVIIQRTQAWCDKFNNEREIQS